VPGAATPEPSPVQATPPASALPPAPATPGPEAPPVTKPDPERAATPASSKPRRTGGERKAPTLDKIRIED
jgi:hypothetical protein